jgi:hypothetical protein
MYSAPPSLLASGLLGGSYAVRLKQRWLRPRLPPRRTRRQNRSSPPKPKPPWLSPEEMALQLSKGHPLLIYSPQELFDMLQSGQNLNVFLDRWVKVAGPTSSLPTQEKIQKQDFYRIELKLDVSRYFIQGKIAAYFDPKKYGEVLLSTRLGGDLQAACQLSKIEPSKPYPNGSFYADVTLYTFDYYNCEPL